METLPDLVPKESLIEILEKEGSEELWVSFMAHTCARLVYFYGVSERGAKLKNRAEQYISEVLNKALVEGTRKWNKNSYSTFKEFLISAIDSHLNNQLKKKPSKEQVQEQLSDEKSQWSSEDDIAFKELRTESFEFLENLKAKDDEMMVFECMADGITKPEAIREELGIDKGEYRNIWRRLKPKLMKLRTKISDHE